MEPKAISQAEEQMNSADLAGPRELQFQPEIQHGLQDPKETQGLSEWGPLILQEGGLSKKH